jgi:hypothetical protein
VYTDFSKAFEKVLHGLLKFNLSILFGGSLLCSMGSYLTVRTQRVKLKDYLSGSIQCHSGVPQGSHLGAIFFILDINGALYIFKNVSVLGYADDLKLFIQYPSAATYGPLNLFIRLMGRRSKGLMKSKTSSRMLGFIKRISRDFRDPYTHKFLYTLRKGVLFFVRI